MPVSKSRQHVVDRVNRIFSFDHPLEHQRAVNFLAQLDESYNLDDPMAVDGLVAKDLEQAEILRRAMSPPDALGLPPLLEARRWEHGIPDGAFDHQPLFDRVAIHQVAQWAAPKATKGGVIYLSDVGRRRERESNPEGIIVGAGLRALDDLRQNGVDLGHRVSFVINAPYRRRVESLEGKEMYVILCRSGEINGSYDLARMLRAGELAVKYYRHKDYEQHILTDPTTGEMWICRDTPLHTEHD